MKIFRRLKYAFQMFWMALTKREIFQADLMRLVESMFDFLKETSDNNRPMTADWELRLIGRVKLNNDEKALVKELNGKKMLHLWCGVPGTESPIIRIRQLLEENEKLRSLLNSEKLNDDKINTD